MNPSRDIMVTSSPCALTRALTGYPGCVGKSGTRVMLSGTRKKQGMVDLLNIDPIINKISRHVNYA